MSVLIVKLFYKNQTLIINMSTFQKNISQKQINALNSIEKSLENIELIDLISYKNFLKQKVQYSISKQIMAIIINKTKQSNQSKEKMILSNIIVEMTQIPIYKLQIISSIVSIILDLFTTIWNTKIIQQIQFFTYIWQKLKNNLDSKYLAQIRHVIYHKYYIDIENDLQNYCFILDQQFYKKDASKQQKKDSTFKQKIRQQNATDIEIKKRKPTYNINQLIDESQIQTKLIKVNSNDMYKCYKCRMSFILLKSYQFHLQQHKERQKNRSSPFVKWQEKLIKEYVDFKTKNKKNKTDIIKRQLLDEQQNTSASVESQRLKNYQRK